jgi:hypothetical protein
LLVTPAVAAPLTHHRESLRSSMDFPSFITLGRRSQRKEKRGDALRVLLSGSRATSSLNYHLRSAGNDFVPKLLPQAKKPFRNARSENTLLETAGLPG